MSDAKGGSITAAIDNVDIKVVDASGNGVKAIVADAQYEYLGGGFSLAQPDLSPNLVALSASGAKDPGFDVGTGFDAGLLGSVNVVLRSGNSLFVGGSFTSYNGRTAIGLAKIDATTGALDLTFTQPAGFMGTANITALAIDGTNLYVAGSWSGYRGSAVTNAVLRLDAETGANDVGFYCYFQQPTAISTLAFANQQLFIGGNFTGSYGLFSTHNLIAVDTTGFLLTDFALDGPVAALLVDTGVLYAAGSFSNVYTAGGTVAEAARDGVAAFNVSDKSVAAFDAGFSPGAAVSALAATTAGIALAGNFASEGLALLDRGSGLPRPEFVVGAGFSAPVTALAADGSALYAASAGTYQNRAIGNFARLDPDGSLAIAGRGVSFGRNATEVTSIAVTDANVFVAGQFQYYDGVSVQNLARFDRTHGAVDAAFASSMQTVGLVNALAFNYDQSELYVGGQFTQIAGQTCGPLARVLLNGTSALTLDTEFFGCPTFLSGGSTGVVNAVLESDGSVYVGGSFDHVNGTAMQNIAQVSTLLAGLQTTVINSGATSGFNNTVNALVLGANAPATTQPMLCAGGAFTGYRNVSSNANGVSCLLASNGNQQWGAGSGFLSMNFVASLAFNNVGPANKPGLFIGGQFQITNAVGDGIAFLDGQTGTIDSGTALSQNLGPGIFSLFSRPTVSAVATSGNSLYLGGNFTSIVSGNGITAAATRISGLARFNISEGTLDQSFTPAPGVNEFAQVQAIYAADTALMVGGIFDEYGNEGRVNAFSVDYLTGQPSP